MPIRTIRDWFTEEEEEDILSGFFPLGQIATQEKRRDADFTGFRPIGQSAIQGRDRRPMEHFRSVEEIHSSTHPKDLNIFESWPRDWEDMGKLERVFSVLNRGQHASANVAWAILQGEGDIATAAWDGLTSKQRGDYVDILRHYDMPWAPVLGTVLNIGLDPVTYVSGPLTLFKRGAKTLGQQKAVKQAVDMVANSNAYKMLNNMFNVHANIPKRLGETMYKHIYGMTAEQNEWLQSLEAVYNKIPKDVKESVMRYIERGERPTDARMIGLVDDAIETFQSLGQRAVDLRILTPTALKNMDYVPHMTKKFLRHGNNPKLDILGPTRTPFFGIERKSKYTIGDFRSISDMYLDLAQSDSKGEILRKVTNYIDSAKSAREAVKQGQTVGEGIAPVTNQLMDTVQGIFQHKRGDSMRFVKRTLRDISEDWAPVEDVHTAIGLYGLDLIRAKKVREFKNYVFRSADSPGWATKWDGVTTIPADKQLMIETHPLQESMKKVAALFKDKSVKEVQGISRKRFGALNTWVNQTRHLEYDDLARISARDRGMVRDILRLNPEAPVWSVDQGVANHLKRAFDLFEGRTKETNDLLRLYDKMVQPWKKWATIYRMPFHVRNAISNTARAYMAGVSPHKMPGLIKDAAKIQLGSADTVTIGGITKTGKEWLSEMSHRGVRGFGFTHEAMGKSQLDHARRVLEGVETKSLARKIWNAPDTVGRSVALAIEDNSRIMVALDKLTKNADLLQEGVRLDDAAKHSWKYLFQYDQLTAFEQGVMKRVFPFYTWIRKNIPLQVEDILDQPGRYSRQVKTYQSLRYFDEERPEHDGHLPEYMRDFGHMRVPDGVRDFFTKRLGTSLPDSLYVHVDLPWGDLANTMQPVKTMLNALSPAALPLQLGLNTKTFPEPGPIERWEGEMKAAPWPVTWLPEFAWPLLGVQPIQDRRTGKQILGMPAKAEFALTSMFPVVSEITRLFPQSADLEAEDAPWRKVRYFTAVNFTPINKAEQDRWWSLERKRRLGNAARLVSQLGRGLTIEEMDAILGEYKTYPGQ